MKPLTGEALWRILLRFDRLEADATWEELDQEDKDELEEAAIRINQQLGYEAKDQEA